MTEGAGFATTPHLHAPGPLLLTADPSHQALQGRHDPLDPGGCPGTGSSRRGLPGCAWRMRTTRAWGPSSDGPDPGIGYRRRLLRGAAP